MSHTLSERKARALACVDELSDDLWQIALDLHAHPETAFQEHRSCRLLTDLLQRDGFSVSTGTGGLETAFLAEHGAGPSPTVAVLAEYDALPEVGHACGHNLIGTAALGAGLTVKAAAPDLPGRLLVLGTPAEEGGGGKVLLARAGIFDRVDAAMMFHPGSRTLAARPSKAMIRVTVEFHGKSAHAATAPDLGISALEAMIQTFVLVNGLRQHLRKDAIIHGVITDGGKAANVIPAYTAAQFSVRGGDAAYRDELVERLRGCVQAAALATGCRGVVTPGMGYANMVSNRPLVRAFEENLEQLGVSYQQASTNERMGSTDMGDVSHLVPAIHPYLAIAPESIPGHSLEFAAAAASPSARESMLTAARALALTCLDLFYRPDLLREARRDFQEGVAAGRITRPPRSA
jgi:amidohydrolase